MQDDTHIADEVAALHARVDALAEDVSALSQAILHLQASERPTSPPTVTERSRDQSFPKDALWAATDEIAQRAAAQGVRGLVSYAGCYTADGGAHGREYRWEREQTAERLLGQDDEMVARVLAALGNKQRLALLKAILAQPGTATELVDRLGLSSSGVAYHHLNTLVAAGLIRSTDHGQFAFVGHQGPAFLVLLSGVWQMLYTRYGTGVWGDEQAAKAAGDATSPLVG
jgi:DNA-binding transcriptional ArsR family regulator